MTMSDDEGRKVIYDLKDRRVRLKSRGGDPKRFITVRKSDVLESKNSSQIDHTCEAKRWIQFPMRFAIT